MCSSVLKFVKYIIYITFFTDNIGLYLRFDILVPCTWLVFLDMQL